MPSKKSQCKPTAAELSIMGVIWELGPCTVRQVFKYLSESQDIGYTTVLKLMQIMTDKGLLERDTSVRPQVFKASRPQQQTQRQLLRELLDRAFDGSPGNLVLQALSIRKCSPQERREIRELLDQLEQKDA
ncbi:MAG: BlaI/MecI/CopY family transcriptional regulator [Phycisphaerales bacterium]|nr:BlaI/MecI/CopY family transcriptional regulator [Phycisphaerales bacterium]